MTIQEYLKRKKELEKKLNEVKTQDELEEVRKEISELNKEKAKLDVDEDERNLLRGALDNLNVRNELPGDEKEIKKPEEEEERTLSEVLESKEYRSAWAKKLMGYTENRFTKAEKRALGDAITTTATEFVPSAEGTQGQNNAGLFIPTSVRTEFMEILSKQSPFFNDIRKLQVAGVIDLPYLNAADDSEWYAELTETKNEGQDYKTLRLVGNELAKNIEITWKADEMTPESFTSFMIEELVEKMGKALITAVLYGDGDMKPTGVTKGLTPVKTGETPIDNIIETYKSLDEDYRTGAKAYISTNVNIAIVSYKDKNGNYPFLQGLARNGLIDFVVDPYLKNNDIVVGNARYYILNTNTPVRIDKEKQIKPRRVIYGAYGIFDGKARPKAFAYGQYQNSVPSV